MSLLKVNNFENSTWADRYEKKKTATKRTGKQVFFGECPYFNTEVVVCSKTGSEKKIDHRLADL